MSETERSSAVVYKSFYDSTRELDDKTFREAWTAILEYAFYDENPEGLSPISSMFFKMAKPVMDSSNQAKEWGKSGGRPKKRGVSEIKRGVFNSERGVLETERGPIYDVDVDVDVDADKDVDVDVDVESAEPDGEQQTTYNHIPTMKEIREENIRNEYGLTEDSLNRFVAYNRERGWKMPMPDALRKWKELEKEKPKQNKAGKFGDFQQRNDAKHRTMVSKVIAMNEGE